MVRDIIHLPHHASSIAILVAPTGAQGRARWGLGRSPALLASGVVLVGDVEYEYVFFGPFVRCSSSCCLLEELGEVFQGGKDGRMYEWW